MKIAFILLCLFAGFTGHAQNYVNDKIVGKWKRSDAIMSMNFSNTDVYIEQFNNGTVYSSMTGKWSIEKEKIIFIDFGKEWMRFKLISVDDKNLKLSSIKGNKTIWTYTKENE